MTKDFKVQDIALQRIILVGMIFLIFSIGGIFVFREKIALMLVDSVQTELLNVTRQNRIYVESRFDSFFSALHYVERDFKSVDFDRYEAMGNEEAPAGTGLQAPQRLLALEKVSTFTRVGLLDIHGHGLEGPDLDLNDYDGFRDALQGDDSLNYMKQTTLGYQDAMLFTIPVLRDGNVKGIMYGVLSSMDMQAMFDFSAFGGSDESFMLDSDGNLFVNTGHSEIAGHLQEYMHDWQRPDAKPELKELYTKVRQSNAGVELITLPSGVSYYISCIPMHKVVDVYMINLLPVQYVQTRIDNILNNVSLVMSVILLLLLIGYAWFEINDAKSQKQIYNLAYYDDTTGIGNREKYRRDLIVMAEQGQLDGYAVAVLDIRGMQLINSFYGYDYGDQILKHIAQYLQQECAANEKCYRGLSDRFYLLWKMDDKAAFEERLSTLLNKISDDFQQHDGHSIYIAAGVRKLRTMKIYGSEDEKQEQKEVVNNISLVPIAEARQSVKIYKNWPVHVANHGIFAIQQAKENPGNIVCFFDEELVKKIQKEQSIKEMFPEALANEEFQVYLQPKYYILGEKPVLKGAEALIRWINPKFGFMPPGSFLPVLEREGVMEKLDFYMAEHVCRVLRHWLDQGYEALTVSVNITRKNIARGTIFADEMDALIAKYNLPKQYVELEILESDASIDPDMMIDFINMLRTRGYRIAMDDFGTGYSNLGLLANIKLDVLKLDRSLFLRWSEHTNEQEFTLVKHMIQVAHENNQKVVAEGIEEAYQVEYLKRLECDYIQGYYFGKPMPWEEFTDSLMKPSEAKA